MPKTDTMEPSQFRRQLHMLRRAESALEMPLFLLAIAWLVLLIIEFVWGLTPFQQTLVTTIWVIFIVDFVIKLVLAPDKWVYLRNNWLTVIALAVPALRVFRVARVIRLLRVARATRGLRLVRVLTSVNRGMRALANSMGRHGFAYVLVVTILVALVGAAGMYVFERETPSGPGYADYGDALWWTAMLLTTIGSQYWPVTPEGRILTFLISLYAFATFGYITAALASFLIGQDAKSNDAPIAGVKEIIKLQKEIAALRAEIQQMNGRET